MICDPTISIIVPAYNVGPYIAETLDSALAQTRRDFEVIVVNDGSTDDTEARIAPYRDRIVYLRHENRGVMATRNAGLGAARGAYIALLDGDDLWEPRFLEVLAGMLDADPDPHRGWLLQATPSGRTRVLCMQQHRTDIEIGGETRSDEGGVSQTFSTSLAPGQSVSCTATRTLTWSSPWRRSWVWSG